MLLVATGVSKRYPGPGVVTHAVREVSLDIAAGDYVALTGPSGCGKSSLLSLLGLLERPDQGSIRIQGQDLATAPEADRARVRNRLLGFVFQRFHLLAEERVLDNVALPLIPQGVPAAERAARAEAMLRRVGLSHRARHWPAQLSGGEQQRVAIARALIAQPRLLLADEPTGNLDSATAGQIIALLESCRDDGVALLIVTHDAGLAARAARRLGMRDGQFVAP